MTFKPPAALVETDAGNYGFPCKHLLPSLSGMDVPRCSRHCLPPDTEPAALC